VSLGCWSAYSPAELSGLTEDHTLSVEMGPARRAGTPLAGAMIDRDQFKGFAERYGHQTGDQALDPLLGHAGSLVGSVGRARSATIGTGTSAITAPSSAAPAPKATCVEPAGRSASGAC
jgi:predicted signal transduction protein with EAL and GGDEF domain